MKGSEWHDFLFHVAPYLMKFKRLQPVFIVCHEQDGTWCFQLVGVCRVSGDIFENVRPSQFGDTIGGFTYNLDSDLFERTLNFIFSIRDLPDKYIENNKYDPMDNRRYISWEGRERAKNLFCNFFLPSVECIPRNILDAENDFVKFLILNNIFQTPPCWLVIGKFDKEYDFLDPNWTFKK